MSPAVLDEIADILLQNAFDHGAGTVTVTHRASAFPRDTALLVTAPATPSSRLLLHAGACPKQRGAAVTDAAAS